jgi:hypothetical protein
MRLRKAVSISPLDFRVAARFAGQDAGLVDQVIRDAVENIKKMPGKKTSFPSGLPVYEIRTSRSPRKTHELVLDAEYLRSFGEFLVPESIWRTLTRLSVWIEPALVAEWIRVMKRYLAAQGRPKNEEAFHRVMQWTNPERDVGIARKSASFEQKIRFPSNAAAMIQRRSLQLSPRATRRDLSLNDLGQGRAVSIGIITSCPPAMIAIWKPLRHLSLPC